MGEAKSSGVSENYRVLDEKRALSRMGGRKHIYLKILKNFIPEFGNASENIQRYLADGDTEPVYRFAHSLKGAAATIGARLLSETAASLEKAVGAKETNLAPLLKRLDTDLNAVMDAIDAYLDRELYAEPVHTQETHTGDDDIGDLLNRLAALLASGDMRAVKKWEHIKELFVDSGADQLVADLDQKIYGIDFVDASRSLDLLIQFQMERNGKDV